LSLVALQVKRLQAAYFDDVLTRLCGVIALPTRIRLVHMAVCDQYGLGDKGLDSDSFAVALMLVSRLEYLQAAPAFITPADAFMYFDPDRTGLLDQDHYDAAMKSLLPHIDASSLATAFIEHCDGEGNLTHETFVEAFLELGDLGSELWKRRNAAYPILHHETKHVNAHTFGSDKADKVKAKAAAAAAAAAKKAEDAAAPPQDPAATEAATEATAGAPAGVPGAGTAVGTAGATPTALALPGAPGAATPLPLAPTPGGTPGATPGGTPGGAAATGALVQKAGPPKPDFWTKLRGLAAAGAEAAADQIASIGSSLGAGRHDRAVKILAREAHFLSTGVKSKLLAVLDEEKKRAEDEQAARWQLSAEANEAAGAVRKAAAIAYKEESALRDKRNAEARVLDKRREVLQKRLARHRKERAALLLQVEIDQKREERERRDTLRAACGADVLSLVGLGMHKLGDFLDPKNRKQGMAGVEQPQVALGQLVEVDVSRNYLNGELDNHILYQLNGLLKFDASHNKLKSAKGLHQLTEVKILRLSHNLLGPSLPDEWGHPVQGLVHLETLSIDNNNLTTLPKTLGGLGSLRRLAAFNNQLGPALPEHGCFGGLTALVELRLRHNKLIRLPQDSGGMRSLQVLDLSYNLLVDLPACLGGLGSLKLLDLSFNRISEVDEAGLKGLTSLQFLELHHNLLVGRTPRAFGSLHSLNRLDLSFNQLESMAGGDSAFERSSSTLEFLDLSHNRFETVPPEIGKLLRLHTLDMSVNRLGSLPAEVGALQSLHVLKLRTNSLTLLPPEMACLSSLQSLDVAENKLIRLPPSFSTLISLTSLDLSRNAIKSPIPSSLGLIPNLVELQMQGNQVSSLPETLGYLRCLRSLDVSNNVLISLPESVSLLRRLTELDLRRNNLRALPIGLGTLEDLRTVEVGLNPLDDMPRNFRDPTSDEVLAWLRRERIFFSLAVREWEAHEAEYASGTHNLNHFLEQVAKGLPPEFAVLVRPEPKKELGRAGDDDDEEEEDKKDKDDDDRSITSKGSTSKGASSSSFSASASASAATKGSASDSVLAKRQNKRAAAKQAAFEAQNRQLKEQVVSFFFKSKKAGVVPNYASVSLNEQAERADVTNLTKTRRIKRAIIAAAEEKELYEHTFDDELRRFQGMFNHVQEAEGAVLLHVEEPEPVEEMHAIGFFPPIAGAHGLVHGQGQTSQAHDRGGSRPLSFGTPGRH